MNLLIFDKIVGGAVYLCRFKHHHTEQKKHTLRHSNRTLQFVFVSAAAIPNWMSFCTNRRRIEYIHVYTLSLYSVQYFVSSFCAVPIYGEANDMILNLIFHFVSLRRWAFHSILRFGFDLSLESFIWLSCRIFEIDNAKSIQAMWWRWLRERERTAKY